jgi:hypothetical protein
LAFYYLQGNQNTEEKMKNTKSKTGFFAISLFLLVSVICLGGETIELEGRCEHQFTTYSVGQTIPHRPPFILILNSNGTGTFSKWATQGSMIGKNNHSHKFRWGVGISRGRIIVSRTGNKRNGILTKWTPVEEEYNI